MDEKGDLFLFFVTYYESFHFQKQMRNASWMISTIKGGFLTSSSATLLQLKANTLCQASQSQIQLIRLSLSLKYQDKCSWNMALSPFAFFSPLVWFIYNKSRLRDGVAETDPYNCYSIHHITDNQMLEGKTYLNCVSIDCPAWITFNN